MGVCVLKQLVHFILIVMVSWVESLLSIEILRICSDIPVSFMIAFYFFDSSLPSCFHIDFWCYLCVWCMCEGREVPLRMSRSEHMGVFNNHPPQFLFFGMGSLTEPAACLSWLHWNARNSKTSTPCVTDAGLHVAFTQAWRSELRPSWLCGKHVPPWAITSSLQFQVFSLFFLSLLLLGSFDVSFSRLFCRSLCPSAVL